MCSADMWLKNVLLIFGIITCILADSSSDIVQISGDSLVKAKHVAATTYQPPRSVSIEEFVTSHKLPEVARTSEDNYDEDYIEEKRIVHKDNRHSKKVNQNFENNEKKTATFEPIRRLDSAEEDDFEGLTSKRQARVELENFSDTGKVLQEERIRRINSKKLRSNEEDEVIPGVYVSAEYPTTMLPILTTPREAHGKDSFFDFVPVNIIREDNKDGYARFSNANFGDLSDVSLVPAGTNSRIQVKKGPNGKDYEYEYVYYYYDEEDENKAGTASSAVTNSYDIPSRTTSAPRRGGTANNRSKYNTVERSSTVEPNNNEVIPNRSGNRGRQLVETDDVSEERLPANTRFPPRSRSNHNIGTTEPSKPRGNRPRPSLDLVDSSSFRTHQEGPEFPQTLPKGPVRFLGVTPNEDNEEKPLIRNRGRPQKVQEPAPVEEVVDDISIPATRRRPVTTAIPETGIELSRGQPLRSAEEDDEEEKIASEKSGNKRVFLEDKTQDSGETVPASISFSTISDIIENPTTEYPSAMDKIALDLYAFLQQGQSNLIDASSSDASETEDITTLSNDEITTDLATTTELSLTTITAESNITTTTMSTTTTSEPTTTTTTTTEPPTTTQVPLGRGKFRRPGIVSPAVSRNRFKSNSVTTEVPALESTQKSRTRFGGSGSNGSGFKRPRPGGNHKPVEEDTIQKETSNTANAERPIAGRGRFRVPSGGRSTISTTTSTPLNSGIATSNGAAGAVRPTFNKLNINRRRGRPTTTAPAGEELHEVLHSETGQTVSQITPETVTSTPKSAVRTRIPGTAAIRPAIRPGARVNLRQKPGQTTTTTLAPETAEISVDEPAGEGTEEETHEAPAEVSPSPGRATTSNPLNKLRNRNRLQVHPKTTTKSPLSPAIRRSPLLPRRKVTEAPALQSNPEEVVSEEEASSDETESTEAIYAETSTAASTKHEEARGLSGLLAPRRRIPARRPGQIVTRK